MRGGRSFDDLVSASEQFLRHSETDRFRGLQVDDQFIFRWCLHRHARRFLALKNPIHVTSRSSIWFDRIRSVTHQPAIANENAKGINGGDSITRCKRDDQPAMNARQPARGDDQAGIWFVRQRREALLNFTSITRIYGT